jgi:hypothetical protein
VHQAVVLDEAAADEAFLAGCAGDRGGAGGGLEGSGVGEAGPVVADLGEDAGCELGAEAGEAEQDLAVGVLGEGGFGGRGEVVCGLAGGVQLLEQGEQLLAEGVLDGREVVGVLGAEDALQAFGLGVEGPGASAAFEGGPSWVRVSRAAFAGVGARVRITRASALVRPPSLLWKACRAAG